ncbi:MAG: AsmA family protein [Candidatus Rokubacteria bacterium]|nr:AsmA family protein [Candidatus Rokubacteria bacterium]
MRLRTLCTIGIALLVLLVGVAAALVAVISTMDVNRYKGVIAQKVSEATGRTLAIQGDLRLTFSLVPAIRVEGVSLANAPWGSAPRMVRVKRLEAHVALLPLLQRQVRVRRLVLVEPEILLETDAEGHRNWDLFPQKHKGAPTHGNGGVPTFHVREVRIKDGRFTYRDGASGRTTTVRIDRLSILARRLEGPLTLKARGAYNGQPAEAKVVLGSLVALLRNDSLPVTAIAKAAGAEFTVDGSVARPLAGEGLALAVTFKTGSLRDLSGLVGQALPHVGPIHFTAKVSEESRTFRVRNLQLTVGQSDLAGDLFLALDGWPRLSARLTSRRLDLADLVPGPVTAESAGRVFPDAPLPVAGLRAFDAHLSLAAQALRAGSVGLEYVALAVTLRDGRLSVSPLRAHLAGGAVAGDLALDARQTPARLTARLEARQVDAGRFLQEVARNKLLSGGKTDAALELSGRGDTLRAVLGGLDGRALFTMGEGRIENSAVDRLGADLLSEFLRILNPLAGKEASTHLRCAVLRLDMKEGVATMDRGLAIETRRVNVMGSGAVYLGTEELNLGLRPEPREGLGIGAGSLVQLVRLRGTLAAPKPELSPTGLVKVGASLGAALATSGISLVAQGLFLRLTADKTPCATVLGQWGREQGAPPSGHEAAPLQNAESRAGGVGGFFKGVGRLERLGSGDARGEPPPATRSEPVRNSP